ncbi:hypothetical protein FisN_14Lh178 [Fistulifera solaris]|uniref:Plastid lipid-associated protein/fibrillin conserved domain-containing protein n=1 Tax=Fistulifera solaris TaxID=1519565 RepID=A0A1Z5J9K5_FISSO|nr:hypothetical protein FisN_14Lh178 [Fistulifera solaris]|eukprot:GAX10670.1 hypothetical protein FisN_14Lh178 [Fistulifera solaris]
MRFYFAPLLIAYATLAVSAFQPLTTTTKTPLARTSLFSSSVDLTVSAKTYLLDVAERLKSQNGVFIVDPKAQDELQKAVQELEQQSQTMKSPGPEAYLGDWTLLCTVATPKSNFPPIPILPNNPIRESIAQASNQYVKVVQRIRSDNNSQTVNRVDHVIEYQPPDQIGNVLSAIPNLPEAIAKLKLPNPLQVSKSKVVLCHQAQVSPSDSSLFTTKLTLTSVVLNVAGTSAMLDPQGADVWGVNLPGVQDVLGRDTFETTYLDDTLRISRTQAGFIDQLRLFVRDPPTVFGEKEDDEYVVVSELVDEGDADEDLAPSDY